MIDEGRLGRMRPQFLDERGALVAAEADEAVGVARIDEQDLAAVAGMANDGGVFPVDQVAQLVLGHPHGIGAARVGGAGGEHVQAGHATQPLAHRRGQGIEGRAHVGEQRAAAIGRNLDAVQHGKPRRRLLIGLVAVPGRCALDAKRIDRAVGRDVGDQRHFWEIRMLVAFEEMRPGYAETAAEGPDLRGVELLVAQHQDGMLGERIGDPSDGAVVQHPRGIDAADLGADRRSQLPQRWCARHQPSFISL